MPVAPNTSREDLGRFTMLVDDLPWTAARVSTDLAELPALDVYPVEEGFFITARRPIDGGFEEFTLRSRVPAVNQDVSADSDTVRMTFRNDADGCRFLDFQAGTLTITEYEPEGSKLTGTFWVTLQGESDCGVRTFTNGHFDIRLPETWP